MSGIPITNEDMNFLFGKRSLDEWEDADDYENFYPKINIHEYYEEPIIFKQTS